MMWQPISTLERPEKGFSRTVLLAGRKHNIETESNVTVGFWDGYAKRWSDMLDAGWWGYGEIGEDGPTHWMPLPNPPVEN
jgi:hypothetical protein